MIQFQRGMIIISNIHIALISFFLTLTESQCTPNSRLDDAQHANVSAGMLKRVQVLMLASVLLYTRCHHLHRCNADRPKQSMQSAVGLQTAIPLAIPHVYIKGDKTLLINMHKRLSIGNPTAC